MGHDATARLSTDWCTVQNEVSSISETWGTESQERSRAFPCDGAIPQPDAILFRGVTVDASPKVLFRWLCQMRAAPYSYDWLDNGGVQSPRQLTPGLDELAVGQEVMRIFKLVSFEQDHQMTLRLKAKSSASRTFGDIAVSYLIFPVVGRGQTNHCRLIVKLISKHPRSLKGRLMSVVLPWGDLIMMRRQLLNLKQLAERTQGQAVGE